MRRAPHGAAALLFLLPALGVSASRTEAQEAPVVSAYRKGSSFSLDVRFPAGPPDSATLLLSRCTVHPSGKVFSDADAKIKGFRRPAGLFQFKAPALSPANVEIRAGDRVTLQFELDGRPLPLVTVAVGEGPVAVAAARPPTPRPQALPATPPAAVVAVGPTAVPEPDVAPTSPAVVLAPSPPAEVQASPPILGGLESASGKSAELPVPLPGRTAVALPTAIPDATLASTEASTAEPASEVAVAPTPAGATPPEESAAESESASPRPAWAVYVPWVGGAAGVLLVTVIGAVVARGRSKKSSTRAERAVAAAGGLGLDNPEAETGQALGRGSVSTEERSDAPPAAAESVGIHVESLIARGGLCDIFLARKGKDRRRCALKVLRPEFRSSASLSEGLVREGEIIRQLNENYPGQVFITLFDQGVFHDSGTDHPYLVLEYVEGPNLRNYVRQHGALEPFTAISAARDLADGLARVHESGFVHGDISPENVMWVANAALRRAGEPRFRLIDFGDSRKFDLDVRAEEIAGKPAFLSPEQTTGAAATPASDVYSLGMVLYFLLAGNPAFQSENSLDILRMHREHPLRFPQSFAPEVCEALATLCEKSPDLRPSAGETVDILDGLLSESRGVA